MKKTIVIAVTFGVLAGIGGRVLLHGSTAEGKTEASGGGAGVEITAANGIVEGCRPEAALRAETVGQIVRLHVRENHVVKKGDLLVELANETQTAQVALARAELAGAQAQLEKLRAGERVQVRERARAEEQSRHEAYEVARREYARVTAARVGASASEVDSAQSKYNQAKHDWDKAKADLKLIEEGSRPEDIEVALRQTEAASARLHLAEAELAKTRLLAPTGGQVLQILAEPGEMAGPTSAQPILIMADLSHRRVRVFVEEFDVARVRAGQKTTVTADGIPGKEFPGHVSVVLDRMGKRGPQSDAPGEYKDVYFREVLVDLDDGQELPTNLRVQARLRVD
jgi:multidrug resistance efflux pump